MNDKTTYHRNGDVTLWDVYAQSWRRMPAADVDDRILSTIRADERDRTIYHAQRCKIAPGEGWRCARCRRTFGASEGYHATKRGAYYCESCTMDAGLALTVST